jgi:hypothetical protein
MKFKLNYTIGCLIIVALLIIFLFRQYPIIEGFDLSMPSVSMPSVSMPSVSMPSSLSMPSVSKPSFLTDYGNIGPIPADTKWSDQTIADFKAKFKTVEGADISQEDLTLFQKYATEDEAKDFIENGKWIWPYYYTNCVKDYIKQTVTDQAVKAGKPAPTDEEITQSADYIKTIEAVDKYYNLPIRYILQFFPTILFSNCIGKLKESVFLNQLKNQQSPNFDLNYKLDDNKILACNREFSNGKSVSNLAIYTKDESAKNKISKINTSYDQFPSLVKGFSFKGPVDSCDLCGNVQSCPFSLNEDGSVSPFYNSYWGLSSSTLSMPSVSMPSVSMPSVSIPKVSMPTFSMPKF